MIHNTHMMNTGTSIFGVSKFWVLRCYTSNNVRYHKHAYLRQIDYFENFRVISWDRAASASWFRSSWISWSSIMFCHSERGWGVQIVQATHNIGSTLAAVVGPVLINKFTILVLYNGFHSNLQNIDISSIYPTALLITDYFYLHCSFWSRPRIILLIIACRRLDLPSPSSWIPGPSFPPVWNIL